MFVQVCFVDLIRRSLWLTTSCEFRHDDQRRK